MKKLVLALVSALVMGFAFAQERKPVIGLAEIECPEGFSYTFGGWDTIRDTKGNVVASASAYTPIESVLPQVRAAISASIVSSKRFSVMERTAAELNKIRQENVETNGEINPNTQLDFLLTGQIVEYSTQRVLTGLFNMVNPTHNVHKIGLSVKFTDVHSGQIVLSETFTKEVKGPKVTTNDCAKELADELIAKIIEQLYPPMILSVSNKGLIQIPNAAYEEGSLVDVFERGEELLDPYTGQSMGFEETEVCQLVVFDVNGGVAKALVANGASLSSVKKGQMCRSTGTTSKKILKAAKKVYGIK